MRNFFQEIFIALVTAILTSVVTTYTTVEALKVEISWVKQMLLKHDDQINFLVQKVR